MIVRSWRPSFTLDMAAVLGPLRHGGADPAYQTDSAGALWLTANTPAGSASLSLRRIDGEVVATAWGDGAEAVLDGVPELLGAADDDSGFEASHSVIADARRRLPGLRLGATGRVWDALMPAILEQKVTGHEARLSWRDLCRGFGEPPPGPAPAGMRVPPTPRALLGIRDWEWHRAGIDGARRRTLLNAAAVANRLDSVAKLRLIPGVGVWTAAEVAQRAWGDPDAVSIGDLHIPTVVGWALVGRPLDDDGMLEVLAPYAPQRQRAVRYVEASVRANWAPRRPRFAPRHSARNYRTI